MISSSVSCSAPADAVECFKAPSGLEIIVLPSSTTLERLTSSSASGPVSTSGSEIVSIAAPSATASEASQSPSPSLHSISAEKLPQSPIATLKRPASRAESGLHALSETAIANPELAKHENEESEHAAAASPSASKTDDEDADGDADGEFSFDSPSDSFRFPPGFRAKRRRLTEIPVRERWRCPNPGCGREYKRTSTTSIGQHRERCSAAMAKVAADINLATRLAALQQSMIHAQVQAHAQAHIQAHPHSIHPPTHMPMQHPLMHTQAQPMPQAMPMQHFAPSMIRPNAPMAMNVNMNHFTINMDRSGILVQQPAAQQQSQTPNGQLQMHRNIPMPASTAISAPLPQMMAGNSAAFASLPPIASAQPHYFYPNAPSGALVPGLHPSLLSNPLFRAQFQLSGSPLMVHTVKPHVQYPTA